ncbi:TPA: retron Ec48 family effector membrane protein [Pseudomonas aeruginosa]|nr:retron Ec48 family effector membrane protein [Pseudomonas aeruginosa]
MWHLISGLNSRVLSLLKIKGDYVGFSGLVLILFYIAFFGLLSSVFVFLLVAIQGGVFYLPACWKNQCIINFFDSISVVVYLVQAVVGLLALIGTIGALIVALLSYLASDRTAKFTNYISHLTLFQAYFVSEVSKLESLSLSSFDVHRMYSFIFSGAKDGVMVVSPEYEKFIDSINEEIDRSNSMAQAAIGGSFRYKEHQGRMRNVFKMVGFNLPFQPKNDFYEIENQLIALVDSISLSFCSSSELKIKERFYR